jgi:MoxR-like ATPase
MSVSRIQDLRTALQDQVGRVVMGQTAAVDLLLVALLAEGHVLLEGVPGTGKTLLARAWARSLSLQFKRIQFTPDLLPGDILGTNLFNFQTNGFVLTKGPIFTELLLADEINRTPPKTQAALLQAMQERAVTIDGTRHELGDGFLVVATQNPIEQEGTYPLPEAQLDRFLFKVRIGYPERDLEQAMVRLHGARTATPRLDDHALRPLTDLPGLRAARETVRGILLSEPLVAYVVDLVRATRTHRALSCGASPRAANMLATAARARAALAGRDFVIPDDLKALIGPVLGHRILLAPASEMEGVTVDAVLHEVSTQVPAPR